MEDFKLEIIALSISSNVCFWGYVCKEAMLSSHFAHETPTTNVNNDDDNIKCHRCNWKSFSLWKFHHFTIILFWCSLFLPSSSTYFFLAGWCCSWVIEIFPPFFHLFFFLYILYISFTLYLTKPLNKQFMFLHIAKALYYYFLCYGCCCCSSPYTFWFFPWNI